tara:strand:+ start:712 stop:885 length:174 start_codon:yes stop_codon:yes gene_type:complete
MRKFLIIFIFFTGCSVHNDNLSDNILDINFSKDMSFEEFQSKLEEYANNSPYPNINN